MPILPPNPTQTPDPDMFIAVVRCWFLVEEPSLFYTTSEGRITVGNTSYFGSH
jgi:hypothetical protein